MLVNRRRIMPLASEEMLAQINAVSTNAGNRTQCGTSLSILVPRAVRVTRHLTEHHICFSRILGTVHWEAVKKI